MSDYFKIDREFRSDLLNFSPIDHVEQSLLAIIIEEGNTNLFLDVYEKLSTEEFSSVYNRKVYEYLVKLVLFKNAQIDKSLIQNQIKDAHFKKYFEILMSNIGKIENLPLYIKEIKKNAKLTNIRNTISEARLELEGDEADPDAIINGIEDRLIKALDARSADFSSLKDIIPNIMEEIRTGGQKSDISSSIPDLDVMTRGFHPSTLVVIGARPSIGKSLLGSQILCHNAENGKRGAFFSLEMSKEELTYRNISYYSRIPLTKLFSGELDAEEIKILEQTLEKMTELPLHIEDSGGLTINDIIKKTKRLKIKHPDLKLVVVDYIGLIEGGNDKENNATRIGQYSKKLKNLAKQLKITVIVLAQLNRLVEMRPNKRPVLSDIRESGDIEQNADVVLLLSSEDYYNNNGAQIWTIEIILAKQRNGPTGPVYANSHRSIQRMVGI